MTCETQDISVEAYSGGRAPEKPRVLLMNGRKYNIDDIVRTWRACRAADGDLQEHFLVRLPDFGECEIIYNYQWDIWTMQQNTKKG